MSRLSSMLLLALVPSVATATTVSERVVPMVIHDHTGVAFDGFQSLTFTIYESDTGGTPMWSETSTAEIEAGAAALSIGGTNPLDHDTLEGVLGVQDRWLDIEINGLGALPARFPLDTVAIPDCLPQYPVSADTDGDGSGEVVISPGMSVVGTLYTVAIPDHSLQCVQGAWPFDCDDSDATVAPGAAEICDGQDNDCNGRIDDNATGMTTYFEDEDGDGFGVSNLGDFCSQPPDTALVGGDCDDARSDVHPDADEVCNATDMNCDGDLVDGAVDMLDWYADGDADGYGDPDISQQACFEPGGYVDNGDDCDDFDETVTDDCDVTDGGGTTGGGCSSTGGPGGVSLALLTGLLLRRRRSS